jgi:GPI mannosyltransferase 2
MTLSPFALHPLRYLAFLFIAWKAFLLLLALFSPGPGYDTSTSLLGGQRLSIRLDEAPENLRPQVLKLVRWDAIYFAQMSSRGHVFEQEWAFGIGLSGIVSLFLRRNTPRFPAALLIC